MSKSRVLVLGFDGLDWLLLNTFIKNGYLPNFKDITRSESALKSVLLSTVPPMSPPAWASIASGMKPEEHGIFDFLQVDKLRAKIVLSIAKFHKLTKIWNILDQMGKRCIVLGFPLMSRPEKLNHGITVVGAFARSERMAWPAEIDLFLKRIQYNPSPYFKKFEALLYVDPDEAFRKSLALFRERARCFLSLLKKYRWDFAFVVFSDTDLLQHFFFHEIDKMIRVYKEFDSIFRKFYESFGESADIVIVSDHGFTAINKYVMINEILYRKGLIKLKGSPPKDGKQFIFSYEMIGKLLNIVPKALIRYFVDFLPTSRVVEKRTFSFIELDDINLKGTWAISTSESGCVYIIRRKRNIIRETEEAIIEGASQYILRVHHVRSTHITAPDLIVEFKKGVFPQPFIKRSSPKIIYQPSELRSFIKRTGGHAPHGVFFYMGEGLVKRANVINAHEVPSILLKSLSYHE